MLFFYGTGTSTAGRFPLPSVTCVNCHAHGSVSEVVVSRYLHFFWIPLFPIGKRAVTVCGHCQQALEQFQWPPAYQQPAFLAKQQARAPLTNYIGLLLLGIPFLLLIGIGAFTGGLRAFGDGVAQAAQKSAHPTTTITGADANSDDTSHNASLLADPQPGDLYVVRYADDTRLVQRVARVTPTTLYMQISTYKLASAAEAVTRQDSLQKHVMPSETPMQRDILQRMSDYGNLAIVRP